MEWNHLFIWLVCASCIFELIQCLLASFSANKGWISVSIIILLATQSIYFFLPDYAGFVAFSLWLPLVLIPALGSRLLLKLTLKHDYQKAEKLSKILSFLHPADCWQDQPKLYKALKLSHNGHFDEALDIFETMNSSATYIGRIATIQFYKMNARWNELRLWFEIHLSNKHILNDPNMSVMYLRSLGETGRLQKLADNYHRIATSIDPSGLSLDIELCKLMLFAFYGDKNGLQKLFNGPLASFPEKSKKYWLATAGVLLEEEKDLEYFKQFEHSEDHSTINEISNRLHFPLISPNEYLNMPGNADILLQASETISQKTDSTNESYWGTRFFILVNCLIFGFILTGGPGDDTENLIKHGALIMPQAAIAGELWRLPLSTFIHFGFAHLTMNMLGLWIFGPFVEKFFRKSRFFLIYLITGFGSMICVLYASSLQSYTISIGVGENIINLQNRLTEIYVGASGSIMGLLGATVAIHLFSKLNGSAVSHKKLNMLIMIFVMQTFFDYFNPNVSGMAHFSGFILGFILSSEFCIQKFRQKNKERIL